MENSNQASPQVPSGLPTPSPMSPQIKAKHNIIPVLIMVGILLALVIGALMMQTVRDGEFALSPKAANMASVGQLAQASPRADGVHQNSSGEFDVYQSGSIVESGSYDEIISRYEASGGQVIHSFVDSDTGNRTYYDPVTREYYDANPTSKPVFYTNGESVEQLRAASQSRAAEIQQAAVTEENVAAQSAAVDGSNSLPPPSLSSPAAGNSSVNTAGADCTGNKCQFENPLGQSGSLEVFLNKLLDVIILIGSIVVVLSIIMAGLKYVTAQGDEGKISDAHKQLTWTVIGAAILLGAKVIAMIVQNTVKALS